MDTSSARRRGEELRRQIMGNDWVDNPLPAEDPLADFGQAATEHVWIGVWARPGLDPRSRSLCTIALMIAQKQSEELRAHAQGALRSGFLSPSELKEIVLHTAAYIGYPAARHAMVALRDILMETPEAGR